MFAHVRHPVIAPHDTEDPHEEVEGSENGDKGQPEPQDCEYLLVEKVNVEYALHSVLMQVAWKTVKKCNEKR